MQRMASAVYKDKQKNDISAFYKINLRIFSKNNSRYSKIYIRSKLIRFNMKNTLTAKEEELMNIFWRKGEMCIRDLVNSLPEPRPSYTTVSTQVSFLESKGFLSRRPVANTFIYEVRISEKEYRGTTISGIVERYYNNSFASVVSQFLEDEKLGIKELKEIIAQIEEKH